MITFLFIYLLPFARGAGPTFAAEWLTIAYVAIVIVVAIAHVGALHFNPVMYVLGYRFYAVRDDNGVSSLLISRTPLRRPQQEVKTVRLAWNIYLRVGDSNA